MTRALYFTTFLLKVMYMLVLFFGAALVLHAVLFGIDVSVADTTMTLVPVEAAQ